MRQPHTGWESVARLEQSDVQREIAQAFADKDSRWAGELLLKLKPTDPETKKIVARKVSDKDGETQRTHIEMLAENIIATSRLPQRKPAEDVQRLPREMPSALTHRIPLRPRARPYLDAQCRFNLAMLTIMGAGGALGAGIVALKGAVSKPPSQPATKTKDESPQPNPTAAVGPLEGAAASGP